MQFKNDSAIVMNKIVPIFTKCVTKNKKRTAELLDIQKIIYQDIVAGENFYNSLPPIKAKVIDKNNFKEPQIFASHFIPEQIVEFVHNNGVYQLEYNVTIIDREVNIRIMLFEHDELLNLKNYIKYVSFICTWLYVCIQHSTTNCSKVLDIYIYPTMLKKVLPTRKMDLISVENVNSAVTSRCSPKGEIVIYRQEEWRKVFIHETFHTFGLDINTLSANSINQSLSNIFSVQSMYSVEEAYAETWARIINSAFASYYSMKEKGETFKEFVLYFNFSLNIERIYSMIQMKKIISFTGLDYDMLTKKSNGTGIFYKEDENTNVFGYYILSGILMNCFQEFMTWCSKHNLNLLKFNESKGNMDSFVKLIKFCSHVPQCIAISKVLKNGNNNKYFKTNLRMSAIEIYD